MAHQLELVSDRLGFAFPWYRVGARELERQTRRGVGYPLARPSR
jgi:hypothetical protein